MVPVKEKMHRSIGEAETGELKRWRDMVEKSVEIDEWSLSVNWFYPFLMLEGRSCPVLKHTSAAPFQEQTESTQKSI